MALDFPASSASPFTAPNGVIYTWNAAGYWEAKADPNDFDSDYLKLDATNGPVTGDLTLNEDLNVGDDLTVAGTSDFTGLTTHEAGVIVNDGNPNVGVAIDLSANNSGSGLKVTPGLNGYAIRAENSNTAGLVNTVEFNSDYAYASGKSMLRLRNKADLSSVTSTALGIYDDADRKASIDFDGGAYFDGRTEHAGGVIVTGSGTFLAAIEETTIRVNSTISSNTGDYYNYQSTLNSNSSASTVNGYLAGISLGSKKGSATRATGFLSNLAADGDKNYNFYAAGSAPNYFNSNLLISNVTNDSADILDGSSNGKFVDSTIFYSTRDGAGSQTHFLFTNANGYCGDLRTNGTAFAISGLAGGPLILDEGADARLVTTTESISNASAVVKQLQPVKINGTRHGFTATALQPLFAEAVSGTADETEAIGTLTDYDGTELETAVVEPEAEELEYTEEVETDGVATMVTRTRTWTPTGTRPVYQGVDQTKLIPLLTKALQEALDRIEQLESNTLQPLYATLADLPSATDHHGKVAHVHSEGALYFAHAGNWVKLQNA